MRFTAEQKMLMDHVFQIEDDQEFIYRKEDICIVKKNEKLEIIIDNATNHEFSYTHKNHGVKVQIG